MTGDRVPRSEFIRQLRAAGPELLARWLAAAETSPELPDEFEVGAVFSMLLEFEVLPMNAPGPVIAACEACDERLEFSDGATPQMVDDSLRKRGWTQMGRSLRCPRCQVESARQSN